jgi:hypothetical protein
MKTRDMESPDFSPETVAPEEIKVSAVSSVMNESALVVDRVPVVSANAGEPDWGSGDTRTEDQTWKVGLNEPVQAELRVAIATIQGMPKNPARLTPSDAERVDQEYSEIMTLVTDSSRFKQAGDGGEFPPATLSSSDDVLSQFDEMNSLLNT